LPQVFADEASTKETGPADARYPRAEKERHRVPQVVPVRSAAVVPAPATPAPTVAAEAAQADDRSVEDRRGRVESPAMTTTGAAAELSSSGSGEDGGGSDSGSGGDGSPSSGGDGDVHDNGA
jgi:hypothetical protein